MYSKNNLISSYVIKNKGLYLLYKFHRNECNELSPYETISKIADEVKKIDDIKPLPDYALEFFDEIKFNIKRKMVNMINKNKFLRNMMIKS